MRYRKTVTDKPADDLRVVTSSPLMCKIRAEVKTFLKKLLVFYSHAANLFKVYDVSAPQRFLKAQTAKHLQLTKYLCQVIEYGKYLNVPLNFNIFPFALSFLQPCLECTINAADFALEKKLHFKKSFKKNPLLKYLRCK